MPSTDTLTIHYTRLADSYDRFLYYSDDFVRRQTRMMIDKLALRAEDRFVDLGGGTGMYTLDIMQQVPLRHATVVDPFPEMLAAIPADAGVEAVVATALDFSEQVRGYDKVLIKEAVHHVRDRARLFANLYRRLSPGGRLLLVHVPPQLDYPVFRAALERSKTWLCDPDDLTEELRAAGFSVERDGLDYRHELPKEHYFRMVENCYMSVLTSFSEEELQAGLREMAERYKNTDTLTFNDHFDYLTAVKPE